MNNRVCIIRSNPVKPDSRVEKEAWTLVNAGYSVHILAWDRDSNHKADNSFITVAGTKIPITRLGHQAAYSEGMKSIVPFLKFQIEMRQWLRAHSNEYDIIHACDFDTAFFSQTYSKKKKLVFDIFDFLYGEPKNLFQKSIKKAQYNIIEKADATIICTEERKNQISGAKPKQLEIIHNTPSYDQMSIDSGLLFQSNTNKIKIAYVGILAEERMLSKVGNYISQHEDVELHIAGFGQLEAYFQKLSEKCENIFFYGRIPYDQALELESRCDIMTAIYDPTNENCRRAAPNKFYESLMLGKPVIMVKETGMSSVVEENGIGELIDYSEEGFGKGLMRLISRKSQWTDISIRMKKLYTEQYSWSEMEKRLVGLYDKLASG